MKKSLIICLLLIIAAISTRAQSGAFCSINGALGGTESWKSYDKGPTVSAHALTAKLGYQFNNNFYVTTGISYFQSGLSTALGFSSDDIKYYDQYKFNYIGIPIALGYRLKLSEKFSLIPTVNFMVSRLLSGKYYSQTDLFYRHNIKGDALTPYNKISLWTGASFDCGYALTNRIDLQGGLYFNSMLSDFAKQATTENGHQQMFSAGFELGFRYNLFNAPI